MKIYADTEEDLETISWLLDALMHHAQKSEDIEVMDVVEHVEVELKQRYQ